VGPAIGAAETRPKFGGTRMRHTLARFALAAAALPLGAAQATAATDTITDRECTETAVERACVRRHLVQHETVGPGHRQAHNQQQHCATVETADRKSVECSKSFNQSITKDGQDQVTKSITNNTSTVQTGGQRETCRIKFRQVVVAGQVKVDRLDSDCP
jgi:hypothetical protein